MTHCLVIDPGTGSTRVALVSPDGEMTGFRSFENVYHRDDLYPDAQYFLPEEWEKEIFSCCEALKAEFPDIKVDAVTAAGARQSFVLLDKEGKAFYALPNIDNRGRDYMDEIPDHQRLYELSGKWVTEDFLAGKLYGLKKLRPELYGKISKVVSQDGWICSLFTGRTYMEPSQAGESQLIDAENSCWSREICDVYGIDMSILPPMIPAGSVLGRLLPEMAGLVNASEKAVFVAGGADTQSAILQTGIKSGDIAVVSGTTSPVVALSDGKVTDPKQQVWVDINFGWDGFITEMNPGVTGLNYQRAKALLCHDMEYGELERLYSEKTSFNCTASFSSLLFYERKSLRHGGFFMRSPLDFAVDRVDMMYAVLADTACAIYEQLWRLREITGHKKDYILCCGGGFRSETLCRMLADLSGLEVRLKPGYDQATVRGLAKLCARALGDPDTGTAEADSVGAVYRPRDKQLIHSYYPVWLENRNRNL